MKINGYGISQYLRIERAKELDPTNGTALPLNRDKVNPAVEVTVSPAAKTLYEMEKALLNKSDVA